MSVNRSLLSNLRVLEVGNYVAAPFCTRLLADLGAEVIKIEPLSGDPVRKWGEQIDGRSLWWSLHGRNKKSVALNLKAAKATDLVLDLVRQCDVFVENLRPGQLARLGLPDELLKQAQPKIVIAHISGYGQSGPGRDRAAFGLIGEAVGGLRYLTNHPPGETDLPPVRTGVSIGDSVAGLYTAFGIMAALWNRDHDGEGREGCTVDVALSESVLSLMEGLLPEYGKLGKIKQPTGGGIATAAPSNAYPTRDKSWVLIGANSDPLFVKLASLMERYDLLQSPDYADNVSRVRNAKVLDAEIAKWTFQYDAEDLLDKLSAADIPSSKAYTAADCAADEQYRYRKMVREVFDPAFGENILHAGVVPHIPEMPGTVRWAGVEVGRHTSDILTGLLGKSPEDISTLREEGVVG